MRRCAWGLGALLMVGTLAAGCGGLANSAPMARPDRPLVPPIPVAGEPAKPETEILGRVATALNSVEFMEGTVWFKEMKGSKEEHGTARFSFRRSPFAARVDIEESNRLLAAGSVVLWNGGSSVRVKRKGIPITVSFSANDSLVASLRGYRLDQTDIFSMGRVLLAPGAEVRLAGRAVSQDAERLILEVRSPASAPGVTWERIGVDAKKYIPTYREMYAGTALVHRGTGRGLILNRRLEPERFKL